jgi:hypothetical protein
MKRALLVLCVLLGACKDSNKAAVSDAQVSELSASDYCESISDFFCDFYLRCGRMHASDKSECLVNFNESCNSKFEGAYQNLDDEGFLELDPEGLAACEAHLDDVACAEQVFELSGPCQRVWKGLVPVGGSCGLDVEFFVCDSQSECVLSLDFCGTCRQVIEIGGTCIPGDTTCGAAGFCEAGTCRARKKNGKVCDETDRCYAGSSCTEGSCRGPDFVALGDACDREHRCPYMTECISGTCELAVLQGEACSSAIPCGTGYCGEGVCKAPHPDGSACMSPGECRSGLCSSGICTARPSACLQ